VSADSHLDGLTLDVQVASAQVIHAAMVAQRMARRSAPSTRGEVLTTAQRVCHNRRKRHTSDRAAGTIKNGSVPCGLWSCAVCSVSKFMPIIEHTLQAWDADGNLSKIHKHVFLSEDDWRDSRRARRLTKTYPRNYWRSAGVNGEQVAFTPGPTIDGGEPISNPGEALMLALLDVPVGGKVTKPQRDKSRNGTADDGIDGHVKNFLSGRLPRDISAKTAHDLVCQTIGRKVETETFVDDLGVPYDFKISGLAPEEVDAARAVLEPLFDQAREETKSYRAIAREFDTLMQLSALDGIATTKSFADAHSLSRSSARARLDHLYNKGSVVREHVGRSYRYMLPNVPWAVTA
jgi:hypothetical protein